MSCYIIAEAGTGHISNANNPNIAHEMMLGNALDLLGHAALVGADAIKFQLFTSGEDLFCPVDGDEKRRERWNRSCMSFENWQRVKNHADGMGIDFLASAFQPTAVEWLKELQPKYYKVASRAAKTYPYDKVPGPFLISNGAGHVSGIPINSFVLDCVMEYPTPLEKSGWRPGSGTSWITDGLSDHSGTIWPGLDAIFHGANFLEVHFGDKNGPDAPVNLTVDQLKLLCDARDAMNEMQNAMSPD